MYSQISHILSFSLIDWYYLACNNNVIDLIEHIYLVINICELIRPSIGTDLLNLLLAQLLYNCYKYQIGLLIGSVLSKYFVMRYRSHYKTYKILIYPNLIEEDFW